MANSPITPHRGRNLTIKTGGIYSTASPLTITPNCTNTPTGFDMMDDTSLHDTFDTRSTLLGVNLTPTTSSRGLMLDQTPPQYMTGPSSAASSHGYSSMSGMLTPFSTNTSFSGCSSRRDSMVPIDHSQTYGFSCPVSPSPPQLQKSRSIGMDQYLSSNSLFSPEYTFTESTHSIEESRTPQGNRRGTLFEGANNNQWFFNDLASSDTAEMPRRHTADSAISDYYSPHATDSSALPQYLNPSTFVNPPFGARLAHLDSAPELREEESQAQAWLSSSLDASTPSLSPTSSEPGFAFIQSSGSTPPNRHVRGRDAYKVVKSSKPVRRLPKYFGDTSPLDMEPSISTPRKVDSKTPFKCQYPGCPMKFGRPEHCNRHQQTHEPDGKEVCCPLCSRKIRQRRDNLKAHIVRTHFTPAEKKKTEKMNVRFTMKEIFERLRDPSSLSNEEQALWLDVFKKPSEDDPQAARAPSLRVLPHEIWPRVRDMDARFARLLSNKMTIHDKEKAKGDSDGFETGKLTKFWKMLGWSIAETPHILASAVAPEWDGPPQTTLWDLDPRRKALMDGTMTVEDADEHLGVSMVQAKDMGFEHVDPRWIELNEGRMSVEDSERHGVKTLNPQWILGQQSRRRKGKFDV